VCKGIGDRRGKGNFVRNESAIYRRRNASPGLKDLFPFLDFFMARKTDAIGGKQLVSQLAYAMGAQSLVETLLAPHRVAPDRKFALLYKQTKHHKNPEQILKPATL